MNKLVIVESPTKARTISKFLSPDYKVESSFGHIRDLPEDRMGVKIEQNFEPEYIIPPPARKRVALLKKFAQGAPEVILATDEDREGEAIAWHLVQALGLENNAPLPPLKLRGRVEGKLLKTARNDAKSIKRIVFHEITKPAIEEALENPRDIDHNLVNAQQARRILDRLVGYELSPFLWKKVMRGLSAGRVQSVAVRLVVEREREIEKFKPQEYWTIEASLKKKEDEESRAFTAVLKQIDKRVLDKFEIKNSSQAEEIIKNLEEANYQVKEISQKEIKRFPAAPFTTSTLQQEATYKLKMSAKQTMAIAQSLYETGFITYMRTDSVNLAEQALRQAREVITQKFGPNYALPSPRRYKTKSRGAQEAHEAIRPTDLSLKPNTEAKLEKRQLQLYDLIWKRTIASQMPEAIFDQTTVDILATRRPELDSGPRKKMDSDFRQNDREGKYIFRATGQVMKFDGFIKVYTEGQDEEKAEGQLPKLNRGEILELINLENKQHFTEPPPRYTDATLVKTLEEYGIGRPSTYAPTISTIIERNYVIRRERKFHPTEIGKVVNDILVEHFPEIMDYQFTAHMEEELDEIAQGQLQWQPVVKEFYQPFKKHLTEKAATVEKHAEATDVPCPLCGKSLIKKFGRFGAFLACRDFPKCKGRKPLPEEETSRICPDCGQGNLVTRRGKFGQFLGCSSYPKCKYIEKIEKKTGVTCPECQSGELVQKRSRKGRKLFWGCNRYPECKYATWTNPLKVAEKKQNKAGL